MVVQVGRGIFWVVNDIRILQKKDGSFWLLFDDRVIELNRDQIQAFGFDSYYVFPVEDWEVEVKAEFSEQ
jgi:hypothetical protein